MHPVWQKRWKNIAWVALGVVTLGLLGAGVYKKNHKVCTGIEVVFDGDGNNFFIDEKGVAAVLKANGIETGLAIEKINLRALENTLKSDQWIANAELFFDNKQLLKAFIREKEPVARIFTAAGSSFYIDSACRRLPLSQKLSARIPMFTGFPSDMDVLSKPDSALLATAKDLAVFIQADEFWKAQVSQVDITPEGFEMYPTVGSHVVLLGKDENYQQKFDRLFSFYKQVWTKVGFEAYEKLDVRFEGQVIATPKGTRAAALIDSAKAIAAIKMLEAEDSSSKMLVVSSKTEQANTIAKAKVGSQNPKVEASVGKTKVELQDLKAKAIAILPKPVNNNKTSTAANKKIENKPIAKQQTEPIKKLAVNNKVLPKAKPKAVLKKSA